MSKIDKTSTIVVTGGNGFLGKALIKKLNDAGYYNVRTFSSNEIDLTSQKETAKMMFYYNPEIIIHLAARVGGIGANMSNPGKYTYDNLIMGANILEEARLKNVSKVITAGTICSYPCHTPVPFKEENLWNGYPEPTNAGYGIAKKTLLALSQAYRQQYGCNFVFLLPVNLLGPDDNFDLETSHVIPAMIRKFHEAKQNEEPVVSLWGDGTPTREFLYVDDCAEAFVATMERYDGADPINVGSGKEISIKELAETIKTSIGYNGAIAWDTSRPNGQPRRCLDVSRAKKYLEWEAKTSLEEGIKKTCDWYVSNSH